MSDLSLNTISPSSLAGSFLTNSSTFSGVASSGIFPSLLIRSSILTGSLSSSWTVTPFTLTRISEKFFLLSWMFNLLASSIVFCIDSLRASRSAFISPISSPGSRYFLFLTFLFNILRRFLSRLLTWGISTAVPARSSSRMVRPTATLFIPSLIRELTLRVMLPNKSLLIGAKLPLKDLSISISPRRLSNLSPSSPSNESSSITYSLFGFTIVSLFSQPRSL